MGSPASHASPSPDGRAPSGRAHSTPPPLDSWPEHPPRGSVGGPVEQTEKTDAAWSDAPPGVLSEASDASGGSVRPGTTPGGATGETASNVPAPGALVEPPGWRRSQWGIVIVVFIAFFGFNFVMPILPLYVRELGIQDISQAALITGLMLAISPLMAAFFSPLWGLLADRFGRKRMVQRSLIVFSVACTLMGLVTNVWQLFGLRMAIGVFGGFTSMTMAYLVAVAPAHRASSALGLLQAAQVGGVIVGPLCAGFVADHYGLRASFFSGSATIVVGLLALTVLTQDDRTVKNQSKAASSQAEQRAKPGGLATLRAVIRLPRFPTVMVILFLAQFVDRSFGPILPLYVGSLGTPPDQIASYSGLIISMAAVGTAISATLVGQLASRMPAERLLLLTLVAGTLLCFPMALARSPVQLLLLRALLGLFAGGTLTLAYSLANSLIPQESKAAAFGVLSSTALLGSASSPLLTGALARFDLRVVFVLGSVLYAVAAGWTMHAQRSNPIHAGA